MVIPTMPSRVSNLTARRMIAERTTKLLEIGMGVGDARYTGAAQAGNYERGVCCLIQVGAQKIFVEQLRRSVFEAKHSETGPEKAPA